MSDLYLSHLRTWALNSPPAEWALNKIRELLIGALRQGPIPRHVSFEMDGNRRYARSHKIETIEGHHHGFEALARALEICYKCGVQVVTVYAFSIENYNRPKFEVDGLMELAKLKLEQLVQHEEILERYGAKVRVLGQRELIRPDVLEVVDRAAEITKNNSQAILNICFPYTSREEITQAIRSTVTEYSQSSHSHSTAFSQSRIAQKILSRQGDSGTSHEGTSDNLPSIRESSPTPSLPDADDSVSSTTTTLRPDSPVPVEKLGRPTDVAIYPNVESITAETLNKHMYTAECPPLDIFVRTSGVERLSNFLLWQCHENAHIFFLKCYWPDFGLWHFLPILLEWQWRVKQKARDEKPQRVKYE